MIRYSIALVLAVLLSVLPQASYAKFMGNRPPAAGNDEAKQSQALGSQILQLISTIFGALGAYESNDDADSLNTALGNARGKLDTIANDLQALAASANDADVLAQQAPAALRTLTFYKKNSALPSVRSVQQEMAQEVSVFSAALADIKFGGGGDPAMAVRLYDAIDRMIYLGAAYAEINYTAK